MSNLPKVIGIAGRKYNGKDTIGDYLVKNYGYKKIAFADPIKEICKEMFGFNNEQLYGSLKETNDEFWNISPRKLMQFIGTELFRNHTDEIMPDVGSNIWIKVLEKKILDNPDSKYVITDIRFENELELVTKFHGLKIKVVRDNMEIIDNHISEKLIDSLNTEFTIKNNGTKEELFEKIDDLLNHLNCKKINNFYNVCSLYKNVLYVLDIDDTIMTYDNYNNKWWREKYNQYKTPSSKQCDIYGKILIEWQENIKFQKPKHTHEESLGNLFFNANNLNNNLIFLTARKQELKDITEKHLKEIGIHNIPVHFSNGDCKGKKLLDILKDYSQVKHVVFIDDQLKNIYNVNKQLKESKCNIDCYHFVQ